MPTSVCDLSYSIQTRFQGFCVKLGRAFLKESPGDEVDRNIDHFLSVYFDTSFENLVPTDKNNITDNFLNASYTLLSDICPLTTICMG